MRGQIQKVAYIGWHGTTYEEIVMDQGVLTGFSGGNGAGKTTFMLGLTRALLPDRHYLVKSQQVRDAAHAHADDLAGIIDQGFLCVALDIRTRRDERLIAGVYMTPAHNGNGGEGGVEIEPFLIPDYDWGRPLQEVFLDLPEHSEAGHEDYLPLSDLPRLAAARGYTLERGISVIDYGRALHEAGVLPTDLATPGARSLYKQVLEFVFLGKMDMTGTRLKDYLLPKESSESDPAKMLGDVTKQIDDIMRTERAIKGNQKNIDFLNGLVDHGITYVKAALAQDERQIQGLWDAIRAAEEEAKTWNEELVSLKTRRKTQEEDMNQAERSLKDLRETQSLIQDQHDAAVQQAQHVVNEKNAIKTDTAARRDRHTQGAALWARLAPYWGQPDLPSTAEMVADHLKDLSEKARDTKSPHEQKLRTLTEERKALETQAPPQETTLAARLKGRTLSEAADAVSLTDALAIEAALGGGGLPGVVGGSLEALAALPADEQTPQAFWMGPAVPEPHARMIGDWTAVDIAGGSLVVANTRTTRLGALARQTRRAELDQALAACNRAIKEIKDQIQGLSACRDEVLKQEGALAAYLAAPHGAAALQESAQAADKALQNALDQQTQTETQRKKYRIEADQKTSALENTIRQYQNTLTRLDEGIANLTRRLADHEQRHLDRIAYSKARQTAHARALEQLGADWAACSASGPRDDAPFTDLAFAAQQSHRLALLTMHLKDEGDPITQALQEAQKQDPGEAIAHVTTLWPILYDVFNERIPHHFLGMPMAEVVKALEEERHALKQQFQDQRANTPIAGIFDMVGDHVHRHVQRVQRLSGFGETLRFGGVQGIRILPKRKEDLLAKLSTAKQALAGSPDLFEVHAGDAPEVLLEKIMGGTNGLRGQEILDYRSYIDIVVQIRRGKNWEPVSGTSGGESIGFIAAIGLMLYRALLEGKNRHKSGANVVHDHEITHLLLIDEVGRLDEDSKATLIAMARREHCHVLVSAPGGLQTDENCTLYCFDRPQASAGTRQGVIIRQIMQTGGPAEDASPAPEGVAPEPRPAALENYAIDF